MLTAGHRYIEKQSSIENIEEIIGKSTGGTRHDIFELLFITIHRTFALKVTKLKIIGFQKMQKTVFGEIELLKSL